LEKLNWWRPLATTQRCFNATHLLAAASPCRCHATCTPRLIPTCSRPSRLEGKPSPHAPPRSYPPSPSLFLLTPSCHSLCCCFASKHACISLASRQCCCLVLLCLAACRADARRCCRYMLGCCYHPSCSKPSWLLLPSRPGCHRRYLPPMRAAGAVSSWSTTSPGPGCHCP
jgi:hypothetical protein